MNISNYPKETDAKQLHGVSPVSVQKIKHDLEQAPQIIKHLGTQLGIKTTEQTHKPFAIAQIHSEADATQALKHLLAKTNTLFKKCHVGELNPQEVKELDAEIIALEDKIAQLHFEKTLTKAEFTKLNQVAEKLHATVNSLAAWDNFLAIDEQGENAIKTLTATVFSNLHGCSPLATQAAHEGLHRLNELIQHTTKELAQPNHPLAHELSSELANSIHATCSNIEDWCYGISSRSDQVLQQTLNIWDAAAKDAGKGDLAKFGKLQQATSLLVSQQKLLNDLPNTLDELEELMQTSLKALPKSHADTAQERTMRAELGQLIDALQGLKTEIPAKQQRLEQALTQRDLLDTMEKAQVDREAINQHVENITAAYSYEPAEEADAAIERYIDTKQALMGFTELSPQAKTFCQAEELRLVTLANSAIDFEGMTHAALLKAVEPPPGFFGRLFQAIHPENWSPTTKSGVHTFFVVAQLATQALNIYNQLPARTLSKADQASIEKELTLLKTLLTTNKYKVLKNQADFNQLTKKAPKIQSALQELLKHSDAPSKALQEQFLKTYEIHRQNALLGKETPAPTEWVAKLAEIQSPAHRATVLRLPDQPSLNHIQELAAGAIDTTVASTLAAKSGSEQLKTASQSLAKSQELLRQCSFVEYIQPKAPTTPKELQTLKTEVALMQNSLREAMAAQPLQGAAHPTWAAWNTEVTQQCFEVRELEKRVAQAMSAYEEALAMTSFQKETEAALHIYGNKHLNLIKQANLQAALNLDGIEIPVPQGVESNQVHHFLQTVAPEVFTEWDELGKLHANYNGQEPFVKTAAAVAHLETIAAHIQKAFAAAGTDENAFAALKLAPDTQQWLDELAADGHYLMVRSTGAEDTKTSANAGGNVSVAYVKPTRAEFCEALGNVVSSYFGAGSLQNRLNAEANPFNEELKLAVTAQKLIGEPIGGAKEVKDIPISLVLFTNEPLYFGDEEFRAMRISATFGHGEGVVGNQGIGSDTILIMQSVAHPDRILYTYDNQAKPERLAPVLDSATGKVSLQKIANPPELSTAPAFSPELIQRIYEWGVVGEKFFDDFPTDMEIVIKQNTIYPVQARPVVRPEMLPTYIDFKQLAEMPNSPVLDTLKLQMIVPGKASVVELSRPEELATADILETAEKQFDKNVHKLVVVGQSEPSNSHPVVNFSSMGMPCLWTPQMGAAQEMAGKINENTSVAICVQSGQMFLWDKTKGSVADYIQAGYVIHPAAISHSFAAKAAVPEDVRVPQALPEEIHDQLFRLQTAVSREAALQELQAIRTSTSVKALSNKIADLEALIVQDPLQVKIVAPTLATAKAVLAQLEQSFEEIEALLTNPTPTGRMELLLHAKILDALLFQTKERATGIAQHSVATLQSTFAATDALIHYQKQLDQPAQFADLLMDGSQSPVASFFDEWQNFLLDLEKVAHDPKHISPAEITRFKDVMQTLRRTNTLPLFATFHFASLKTDSPAETLRAINALIPIAEEARIQQLLSESEKIAQLNKDIGLFGNPKAAAEAWERLQITIAPFLPPQNTWMEKSQWDALSPITRSIATQTLNELVDVYDVSIKAMKASPELSDLQKTKEFKKMLVPYLQLLLSWAEKTVGAEGFVTHPDWPLEEYLNVIEATLTRLNDADPNQLRPSSAFSVSAAALGARTAFERHFPERLEDVFTLIHQNLLATTSILLRALVTAEQMQAADLPQNLRYGLENAGKVIGSNIEDAPRLRVGSPQLIGMEVTAQKLTFNYNVPLRNHSSKFSITYNREAEKLNMQAQFFGQARERWGQVLERAHLLSGAGILSLTAVPKLTPQEVSLAWDVTSPSSVLEALQEYQLDARRSMTDIFTAREVEDFADHLAIKGDLRKAVLSQPETESTLFAAKAVNKLIDEVFTNPLDPLVSDAKFIKKILRSGHPMGMGILPDLSRKLLNSESENKDLEYIDEKYRANFAHTREKLETFDTPAILDLIASAFLGRNERMRFEITSILKKLLTQEKGFAEVLALAQLAFKGPGASLRKEAVELFKALFAHDKNFDEALKAAQIAIVDPDWISQSIGIELFKALFAHDKGFDEALKAAQIAIVDPDPISQSIGIELFKALVNQKKGLDEALKAAQVAVTSPNEWIQTWGLELFKALVNQKKGLDEALKAAQVAVTSPNEWSQLKGLELFKALVNQKKGFEEAIKAAQVGFTSPDAGIQLKGLELFQALFAHVQALVNQKKGFEEAIKVAQVAVTSPDAWIQLKGLKLFKDLFTHDKGFEEAAIAAKQGLQSDNPDIVETAQQLMKFLESRNSP